MSFSASNASKSVLDDIRVFGGIDNIIETSMSVVTCESHCCCIGVCLPLFVPAVTHLTKIKKLFEFSLNATMIMQLTSASHT